MATYTNNFLTAFLIVISCLVRIQFSNLSFTQLLTFLEFENINRNVTYVHISSKKWLQVRVLLTLNKELCIYVCTLSF